jgi:phosphoribosyl-ATP pyrophosphohydrolase/phosphoribosyl-AMP cyclohydrolase
VDPFTAFNGSSAAGAPRIGDIKFDDRGLVPAIASDADTNEVLMLAYMNEQALSKTLETGQAHYFSRSRDALWRKGETSGHVQTVRSIYYDCDCDALLLKIDQAGVACHTGNRSCFFRKLTPGEDEPLPKGGDTLSRLYAVLEHRRLCPTEGSYTNYLFEKGIDKILKKVGEESAEVIIAAKNSARSEIIYEISDLIYHLSVLMLHSSVSWSDIYRELDSRATSKP